MTATFNIRPSESLSTDLPLGAPASWAEPPDDGAGWLTRADEVAALLRPGAIERDRQAGAAHDVAALLRDSGLVTLIVPARVGGGGQPWSVALDAVRRLSRVDNSIAQVLGWNYAYYDFLIHSGTAEQQDGLLADLARSSALLGGAVTIIDEPFSARDDGDHLVLDGRKIFNTGVPLATRVLAGGRLPEGGDAPLIVVLAENADGLSSDGPWDTLGQRGTASGAVRASGVRAPWSDAIGYTDKEFQPRPGNVVPGLVTQELLVNYYLGVAEGALADGVAYVQQHSRSWLHSPYERAVDEPHVVDGFGDLQAKVWAAGALVAEVNAELSAVVADTESITEDVRGELAARIAGAKIVTAELALEVGSKVLELSGARSTAKEFGLERHWRDARTQTLHDPVAYKRRQLGAFLLTGELPNPPDFYT